VETYFQQQEQRIDRLMKIIRSDDQYSLLVDALTFYDIVIFACQCMWHLKDWILNDPECHPKAADKLEARDFPCGAGSSTLTILSVVDLPEL
jgi:hypothetical protein